MKIGILTLFHGNDNWGGTLQGAALKALLEELYPNAIVDIIDYRSNRNIVYSNKLRQALQYNPAEIVKKVAAIYKKKFSGNNSSCLAGRKNLFNKFREPYITNKHVYTDLTLSELEQDYDVLVCGSDQIWNPNVARPGFLLAGIGNGCRKISYAASIARDSLSSQEKTVMIPLIERFDFISVREKTARNILQECTDKPVYEVLDPALMLDAQKWNQIVDIESYNCKPYALAFFFSDSLEYRRYIEKYCSKLGLELHFIPFAAEYIKNDELGQANRIFDIGPKEFLEQFKNASCVFTDSFHGSVFSLIFQKEFWVFERDSNNKVSKNSRLYDLLDKFELSDRLVKEPSKILSEENGKIDYSRVGQLLEVNRERSKEFILKAIGGEEKYEKEKCRKQVNQLQKEECCGCGLCASICPRDCIKMEYDEQGWLYPNIDAAKCINCGKCLNICREKSAKAANAFLKKTYIGYNKDEKTRSNSSSGGFFYGMASWILDSDGVVYGAAFGKQYQVEHVRVTTKQQLDCVLRSKYVQSDFAKSIDNIEADLRLGKLVLVVGTPCQAAAIAKRAEQIGARDNLYLIDFICHGVPSPGVWQSYLQYIVGDSQVHEVNFRDKSHAGWHDYYLHIQYGDNSHLDESHELNAYMRSFLSDQNLRLACYNCCFKGENYASDITLGDAWKIEKDKPEWADDKGTSLIIVRSPKGERLLSKIQNKCNLVETDYNEWTKYNPSIIYPTAYKNGRDEFFNQYKRLDTNEFWTERKKIPMKKQVRYQGKRTLKFLGLDKIARQKR